MHPAVDRQLPVVDDTGASGSRERAKDEGGRRMRPQRGRARRNDMAKTPKGGLHRISVVMLVIGILSLGVAGTPVAAEHTSADHGVLVVDKDKVECPDAEYQSIQAAVNAAAPGSRIRVCPDLYAETVTVNKPLALEAFRSRSQAKRCHLRSTDDPNDTTRDVVVTRATPAVAFDLRATGIVVDGFVIQAGQGVESKGAWGYVIRRNLFQGNFAGLDPGGDADVRSVVSHNCFRDNFIAVRSFSTVAPAHNVLIAHNQFFSNNFGIRLGGANDVTISHNTSLNDGMWLRIGGLKNLTVRHNHIGTGAFEGILFIPLGGVRDGAPNSNALITHNVITGRGLDGFSAGFNPPAMVNSVLAHNHISGNGRDGIRIEAGGNTGNRIEDNYLRGNAEHDCHDDTTGSGTAGTANVWFGNKAHTENRVGLCTNGA